jgi:phospho-N-acetylmuramoyl-pentapeptide-transferase
VTYALLTGCVAAIISALAGVPFIALLRERKIGKAISAEGPETHLTKEGTPTMGGILIVAVALLVALAAAVPKDRAVLLPIAVALVFLVIGVWDDFGTLIDRGQREAHDRTGMIMKIGGFAITGIVAGYVLYDQIDAPRLLVPHYGSYDIGPGYVLIAIALIVAVTSAEGVTDGLDMLSGSLNAVAFSAFGAIALMQHDTALATFCFVVVGALVGFLWHNAYPAHVFMGDSGALPLGGALAVVALMTGWWLLAPVIGVVFVAEILSDVIQIGYFRLSGGRRVFRMAPLHHHFEKLGWHETTVTARFVAAGVVGAMCGVALVALN